MNKKSIVWLSIMLSAVLMAGCSKKEESNEQAESTSQPTGTAIDQSTVGSVSGKVKYAGAKPKLANIHMDQDQVCVSKHSSVVKVEDGQVNDNGTLPNVFVYVKDGADKYTFATPTSAVTLDQNGCMYKPHVLGLQVNQTLHVISSDATTHNIHPQPKDNREWNESQAPGAAPLDKKFARAEVMIPVKCNQHPWMKAYVGVTKNPFFAVTGSDGSYTITGLPPGDYTIGAWSAIGGAQGQSQEQKVTVGSKESKTLDFNFKG